MTARAGEVVARVRGTSKYRVRVRLRGSKLLASCTCPYFNPQGEPCKHLWATLLLAEARGLLHSPPVFPVHLVPESPRQTSHDGSPDLQRSPGLGRQSTELGDLDLGLEMMGLVPSRPVGPSPRRGKGKDRYVRGDQVEEQGNWSQRGRTSPRDYQFESGGRSKIKSSIVGSNSGSARPRAVHRNGKRLLVYVLDVSATLAQNQVVIDLARRQRKAGGEWGPLRPWYYAPHAAHVKYDPEDRLLLALLDEAQGIVSQSGNRPPNSEAGSVILPGLASGGVRAIDGADALPQRMTSSNRAPRATAERALRGIRRFALRKDQATLVERLARMNRLRLRRTEGEEDPPTVRWDDGQPWRFMLEIRPELGGKRWTWRGSLRRGDNRMDLSEPLILLPGLLILGVGRSSRFDDLGVMPWILRLRYEKEITFAEPQQDLMLGRILVETRVPPSELVESLQLEEIKAKPRPCLTLRTPRQNWGLGADKLIGELHFEYDGALIPAGRTTPLAVSTELGVVIRRDPAH